MKIQHVLLFVLIYTFAMGAAQVLLKIGATEMGGIKIRGLKDLFILLIEIFKNKAIVAGIALMLGAFIPWILVLSWAKLSLVFPLTALIYVVVAVMSYFILAERLALLNYFGMFLIFTGVVFLLHK